MTGLWKTARILAATAAVALAATACSSGSGGSGGSGGGIPTAAAGKKTIKVGVLTDVTGPAASGNKTTVEGVRAGTYLAGRHGYTIKYVVGDTATNPATVQSAAQKLVTQDHVSVVIAVSALAFAAAPYLTSRHIPVVGMAQDGPEWVTAKNMFSVAGPLHTGEVWTTTGLLAKSQGVTTIGSIGYGISPVSADQAKAAGSSVKAVGLQVGYLNAKFPFGGTDVAPEALAMKKAGVDGLLSFVDPNTAFALVTALRQQGVDLKAAMLPTGYGGDLLQAGPGALEAAQNVYFNLQYEPVEMKTAATKQFQADLASAGVTGEPTYAEYNGYASTALLVQALEGAGSSTSGSAIISSLSKIHSFDAAGLFGSHPVDISERTKPVFGACQYATKLEGKTFTLVKGADPICGRPVSRGSAG